MSTVLGATRECNKKRASEKDRKQIEKSASTRGGLAAAAYAGSHALRGAY